MCKYVIHCSATKKLIYASTQKNPENTFSEVPELVKFKEKTWNRDGWGVDKLWGMITYFVQFLFEEIKGFWKDSGDYYRIV